MWNIRTFLPMATVSVGLAFAASSPASAQSSGSYGWGGGFGVTEWGGGYSGYYPAPYVLAPAMYGWSRHRPGGPYDVGWEGGGYGWGNNWGYLELTPSQGVAPPIVTLRPPS
jgi:hypothetical protein